jgi:hypothetical protein
MLKHEEKICPRCSKKFECKVGSILLCQCTTVKLSEVEKDYISEKYSDCLCADCMKELRAEYHNKKLKNKIKKLLGVFGTRE